MLLRSFSIHCLNCTLSKTRNIIVQTRIHSNNLCECVFLTQKNNELCKKKKIEREWERSNTKRDASSKWWRKKKYTEQKKKKQQKNLKVRTKQDFSIVPNGPRLFWHKTNWKYFLFDCAFFFTHCSLPFKLVQCVCMWFCFSQPMLNVCCFASTSPYEMLIYYTCIFPSPLMLLLLIGRRCIKYVSMLPFDV